MNLELKESPRVVRALDPHFRPVLPFGTPRGWYNSWHLISVSVVSIARVRTSCGAHIWLRVESLGSDKLQFYPWAPKKLLFSWLLPSRSHEFCLELSCKFCFGSCGCPWACIDSRWSPGAGTGALGCWLPLEPPAPPGSITSELSAPVHTCGPLLCVHVGNTLGHLLCGAGVGHTDQTLPWLGVDANTAEQSPTLRTGLVDFAWA